MKLKSRMKNRLTLSQIRLRQRRLRKRLQPKQKQLPHLSLMMPLKIGKMLTLTRSQTK